jgi:hypothetical protein
MTDPGDIVDEARAAVAAGRAPDWNHLARRIHEAGLDDAAEQRALAQLARVETVARARASVARTPEPPPRRPVRPRGTTPVSARPTLSGTIEVRRERQGDEYVLAWPADPSVFAWDVRVGVRADARSAYVDRESVSLPEGATSVPVPVGDGALRVHVLGRGRGGRLVRRALVTGLTRENWDVRWQRRPSAA